MDTKAELRLQRVHMKHKRALRVVFLIVLLSSFVPLQTNAANGFFETLICKATTFFGFPCVEPWEPMVVVAPSKKPVSLPKNDGTIVESRFASTTKVLESIEETKPTIVERGADIIQNISNYITKPTVIEYRYIPVPEVHDADTTDFVSTSLFQRQNERTQDNASEQIQDALADLSVSLETGAFSVTGAFSDSLGSTGSNGFVLQSTGAGVAWVATSTLGITGGGGGGLASTDIDTSSELASILGDEVGTGRSVFSISPTFGGTATFSSLTATGTSAFATSTQSGRLTLSGIAANIALGSNYLSGDGDDEGVFVDSSGNVGIGTSTSIAKLTVKGPNDSGTLLQLSNGGAGFFDFARNHVTGSLSIQGGQSGFNNILLSPTSGNVGIGTSTPVAKLDVQGSTSLHGLVRVDGISSGGDGDNHFVVADSAGNNLFYIASTFGQTTATFESGVQLLGPLYDETYSAGTLGYILQTTGTGVTWVATSTLGLGGGGGLASTDIDTSSELLTILTDETGSGNAVFSVSPEFSGLPVFMSGLTASGTLDFSGTEANIALGSNYLSGDGDDEGVFVDGSGNVGIGTTTPVNQLSLETAIPGAFQIYRPSNKIASMQFGNSIGMMHVGIDNDADFAIANNDDIDTANYLIIKNGTGNVGIGTTTPGSKLTVIGDIAIPNQANNFIGASATNGLLFDGTGNYNLSTQSTLGLANVFDTDNNGSGTFFIGKGATDPDSATHFLDITNGGYVGIGTTTPIYKFTSYSGAGSYAGVFGDNTGAVGIGTYSGGYPMIQGGSDTAMTVSKQLILQPFSGNVGIGTTTPASKLNILSTTEQLRLAYSSTQYWSDTVASDGGRTLAGFGTDADLNLTFGGATDGDFSINTDDLFVDTSTGNVGVGNSSPSGALHVSHTYESSIPALGSPSAFFNLTNASAWGLIAGTLNTGDAYLQAQRIDATATAYDLLLQPNGGNIGIGTANPFSRLTVQGVSSAGIVDVTSGDTTLIDTDLVGQYGFRSIDSDAHVGGDQLLGYMAGVIEDNTQGGSFAGSMSEGMGIAFYTSGSRPSSNAAFVPAEAMRITKTGNVGIGTTSPWAKLDILGEAGTIGLKVRSGGNGGINIADFADVNGSGLVVINPLGKVGIGTTTPQGNLHIYTSASGGTANGNYANIIAESAGNAGITVLSGASSDGALSFGDSGGGAYGRVTYSHSNDSMAFYTGNGRRVTLTATGLGIGTTTPAYSLHVNNYIVSGIDSEVRAYMLGDATQAWFGALSTQPVKIGNGDDYSVLTIDNSKVGIGTTTPADKLDVYGDIRIGTGTTGCVKDADGTTIAGTCSSDERLKTNILPISESGKEYLAALVALEPVTYNWNELAATTLHYGTTDSQTGLIAQQVEETMPELVTQSSDGYKQVRFSELPIYLLQALRELWTIVTGNQEKIELLEDRIEVLENALDVGEEVDGTGGGGGVQEQGDIPPPEGDAEELLDAPPEPEVSPDSTDESPTPDTEGDTAPQEGVE